jgi:hypothetical protein
MVIIVFGTLTKAASLAQINPIGGLIARTGETGGIHKSFNQQQPMTVNVLPN